MATAGSIVVDLLMRTGSFETDTARAEKLMQQRMKAIEESVNSAASAIALGGVAIAGGMMLWVKQAADAADQLDQLSERTGVAVDTLNGLTYATRMSGGDIGELEKGLQSLNKKLSEVAAGDKSAKEMFKALGITATTAEDALMQLADVFPQLNKQDQVRVGTELLSKSYQSLVPLLAQGRYGLRSLIEEGQALNPITAEAAAQAALFNDNMDRLKALSDSAAISLGNSLIPAINDVASKFIKGMKDSEGFFNSLFMATEGTAFGKVIDAVSVLSIAIGGRLTASLGASAIAFSAATLESMRYQATLARMAGVSASAAAGQAVLGGAATAASASMRVLGGPVGIALTAAGTLAYFAMKSDDSKISLDKLAPSIDTARESFAKLSQTQASAKIYEVQDALRETERQAGITAARIETVERNLRATPGSKLADDWSRSLAENRAQYEKLSESAEQYKKDLDVLQKAASGFVDPASVKTPVLPSLAPEKKKEAAYTDPLADEAKAYASAIEAINKAQLSAQMSGMELTATQQRLVDLFASSEFLQMPDTWKQTITQQAEAAIAVEQHNKQMQDYLDLVKELNTEEERRAEKLRESLKIIDAMQQISQDERSAVVSKAIDAATSEAPQYAGLAPEVGGAFSEFKRIDDAQAKLEEWYQKQLEMLAKFREERNDLAEQFNAEELRINEQHRRQLEAIEQARTYTQLSAAENAFGTLTDMARQFAGEQSEIYRAAFAIEKAAAIARSIIAIQQGIAMAAANPWPMNLAAMASVAAATASIVSNIASVAMPNAGARANGGPVSADMPYLIGERGPELFVPNTAGRVLPNSALGGNAAPTINLIEDRRRAGQTQQRNTNGRDEIDVFVADILGDGPRAKAVQKAFGLQRRGY